MKFLRAVNGFKRFDRFRNVGIKTESNLKDLNNRIDNYKINGNNKRTECLHKDKHIYTQEDIDRMAENNLGMPTKRWEGQKNLEI